MKSKLRLRPALSASTPGGNQCSPDLSNKKMVSFSAA